MLLWQFLSQVSVSMSETPRFSILSYEGGSYNLIRGLCLDEAFSDAEGEMYHPAADFLHNPFSTSCPPLLSAVFAVLPIIHPLKLFTSCPAVSPFQLTLHQFILPLLIPGSSLLGILAVWLCGDKCATILLPRMIGMSSSPH